MPFSTLAASSSLFHHSVSATPADILANARVFIKDKLYFTCLSQAPPNYNNVHFFTIDHVLVYINFYSDFGPNSMAHTIRFCEIMQEKMRNENLKHKKICLYSSLDSDKRANAAYLMCAYMLIGQKKTPEEAFQPLVGISPPFLPYRDAGYGPATYHITILDCLKGLYKALQIGLVNLENIDPDEYEFYEKVENGDLNWLTDKFIAMASPKEDPPGSVQSAISSYAMQQQTSTYNGIVSSGYNAVASIVSRVGYPASATAGSTTSQASGGKKVFMPAYRMDDLIRHLKGKGVTTVVRLNNKIYDRKKFVDAGIEHVELYFPDGTTPPDGILKRFLDLCETRPGVIAVHCKAGLGRTGTLISAYLMKHYKFTASEVIGLLRVLRPGSVVGPQQNYLQSMQPKLWKMHPTVKLPQSLSLLRGPTFPTSQRFPASDIYEDQDTTPRASQNLHRYSVDPMDCDEQFDDGLDDDGVDGGSVTDSRAYSAATRATTPAHYSGRPITVAAPSAAGNYFVMDPAAASAAAATAAMNISAKDYEGAGVGSNTVAADGTAIPIQPRKQSAAGANSSMVSTGKSKLSSRVATAEPTYIYASASLTTSNTTTNVTSSPSRVFASQHYSASATTTTTTSRTALFAASTASQTAPHASRSGSAALAHQQQQQQPRYNLRSGQPPPSSAAASARHNPSAAAAAAAGMDADQTTPRGLSAAAASSPSAVSGFVLTGSARVPGTAGEPANAATQTQQRSMLRSGGGATGGRRGM
ncbi:dual specificity protein phosphatase [Zopfochytrium polystomum]|nr:dual specificity protein phosphatase [Zopfochytrium polystomum]